MDADLHRDVLKRLIDEFGFKEHKSWLQHGVCPNCHKKELYAHAESPWVVRCGRINKCAWEGHVKDLYEDLFESWSDRYPASQAAPLAAADAYLVNARGFEIARLRDAYSQEWYVDRDTGEGSATVRFAVTEGCYWERLIDRPSRFGNRKAGFGLGQSYRGHAWRPPATLVDLAGAEEVWVVEGIFDAIALGLAGIAALSAMAANNYPDVALATLIGTAGKRPRLVWALDTDPAGFEYIPRWVRKAREDGWQCKAAQIPQPKDARGKLDWNDLWLRGRLRPEDMEGYLYEGSLLIAATAAEKARLIYQRHGFKSFSFEFGERMYWWQLNMGLYDKAMQQLADKADDMSEDERRDEAIKQSGALTNLANCHPVPLYFQQNKLTNESWYYYRVTTPYSSTVYKNTFKGEQVAGASEFKKRLLSVAPGAMWEGTTAQLDRTYGDLRGRLKIVETVEFVGYAKEYGAYIFGDLAVMKGRVVTLNDEDYFELSKRLSLKTINQSVALNINPRAKDYNTAWPQLVWDVFGPRGMVALVFWFGSLFAEQIRALQESFPFFEIVGEPGSGKSTLVLFLNRLLGRPTYEGFDPAKATAAGRSRNFAQLANLPVVLMEGDRDEDTAKAKKFDFDELKSLYNGRSTRATGVKNNGTETYEPPFRASIVIEQNRPVKAEEAIMQRICHVFMTCDGHSAEGKAKADRLSALDVSDVSYFILAATRLEAAILERFTERMPVYEKQLMAHPKIHSVRLAKNHAQLMALVDGLELVLPQIAHLREPLLVFMTDMAVERHRQIGGDHPIVSEFWDRFEHLNDGQVFEHLNHSRDAGLIAVNLHEYLELAGTRYRDLPTLRQLKEHLPTSRKHKFIDATRSVNSAIHAREGHSRTVRCWVFQKSRHV